MMIEYERIVEGLITRSHDVLPLPQRHERYTPPPPRHVTALCSYKQLNVRDHTLI